MPPRDDAGAASVTPRPMRSGCRSSAGSSPRRSRTIPIQKASRPGSSNAASAGPRLTRWARCAPWRETGSGSGGLLGRPPTSEAGWRLAPRPRIADEVGFRHRRRREVRPRPDSATEPARTAQPHFDDELLVLIEGLRELAVGLAELL